MRCEVCGRKIHQDPVRAKIEGATLTVCVECSKHGQVVYGEPAAAASTPVSPTKSYQHIPVIMKKPPVSTVQISQEVVEDYANVIRVAREKMGLTLEDLGKKVAERASLLKHIENGKVEPNNQLASRLEHVLKITLMVAIADEKVQVAPKRPSEGMTLGDLIDMSKADEEAPKKRK
ncbi:MAG TPA: multiprotein bridging factor aMBF1, partial [Candidatus Acidoferrales bacterium]|nr:multiprotein bridging factor aMBF1 [Candidatus Acidoferrales bacterium]